MSALGAHRISKTKQLGALTTTTEYCLWWNDTGQACELEAVHFNQLDAISHATTGFYTFDVYEYTAEGTQGNIIATLHYGTASAAGYDGDHVAFVGQPFTLDTTGLGIPSLAGLSIKATKYGTAVNLSADAEVFATIVEGMTSAH